MSPSILNTTSSNTSESLKKKRIYAIGDIHGRLDLLQRLHELILNDANQHRSDQCIIIYLGDSIDRGPESKQVIETLIRSPLKQFISIHIKGNHEALLLDFLKDPNNGELWLLNGGLETLKSYGVVTSSHQSSYAKLQHSFLKKLPSDHLTFFKSLVLFHIEDNYFFCHGGINPDRSLTAQTEDDLLWIREPFLTSTKHFGKIIVHGHSISRKPEIKTNRIGIDTGAIFTDCLTCVVLSDKEPLFLQTISH